MDAKRTVHLQHDLQGALLSLQLECAGVPCRLLATEASRSASGGEEYTTRWLAVGPGDLRITLKNRQHTCHVKVLRLQHEGAKGWQGTRVNEISMLRPKEKIVIRRDVTTGCAMQVKPVKGQDKELVGEESLERSRFSLRVAPVARPWPSLGHPDWHRRCCWTSAKPAKPRGYVSDDDEDVEGIQMWLKPCGCYFWACDCMDTDDSLEVSSEEESNVGSSDDEEVSDASTAVLDDDDDDDDLAEPLPDDDEADGMDVGEGPAAVNVAEAVSNVERAVQDPPCDGPPADGEVVVRLPEERGSQEPVQMEVDPVVPPDTAAAVVVPTIDPATAIVDPATAFVDRTTSIVDPVTTVGDPATAVPVPDDSARVDPATSMTVVLKRLGDEEDISVLVAPTATLEVLKSAVEEKAGLPADRIVLSLPDGTVLKDGPLEGLGVKHLTELMLLVRRDPHAMFQIFVKDLGTKTVTLEVTGATTVRAVTEMLQVKFGIAPEDMRLIAPAGKEMEMDSEKTMDDYNLQKETTLQMIIKMRGGDGCYDLPGEEGLALQTAVQRSVGWSDPDLGALVATVVVPGARLPAPACRTVKATIHLGDAAPTLYFEVLLQPASCRGKSGDDTE